MSSPIELVNLDESVTDTSEILEYSFSSSEATNDSADEIQQPPKKRRNKGKEYGLVQAFDSVDEVKKFIQNFDDSKWSTKNNAFVLVSTEDHNHTVEERAIGLTTSQKELIMQLF